MYEHTHTHTLGIFFEHESHWSYWSQNSTQAESQVICSCFSRFHRWCPNVKRNLYQPSNSHQSNVCVTGGFKNPKDVIVVLFSVSRLSEHYYLPLTLKQGE